MSTAKLPVYPLSLCMSDAFTATQLQVVNTLNPTLAERQSVINFKTNRNVTEFQYKVYDLCSQIPAGKITIPKIVVILSKLGLISCGTGKYSTYKEISDALNSSPRAVGQVLKLINILRNHSVRRLMSRPQALRNNPLAPVRFDFDRVARLWCFFANDPAARPYHAIVS